MAKWAFVQAMSEQRLAASVDEVLVSFRHTLVDAKTEDAAQIAGWKWSDAQNNQGVVLLNDYVFEV